MCLERYIVRNHKSITNVIYCHYDGNGDTHIYIHSVDKTVGYISAEQTVLPFCEFL